MQITQQPQARNAQSIMRDQLQELMRECSASASSENSESRVQDQLRVEREDIVFYNVAPDRVRLEITVTNVSLERSRSTELHLQAAPLGAFLPWKDLTTLWVPPLGAGEAITLSTEVSCPRPRPLGRFDRVPPEHLLTALGLFDDDEEESGSDRSRSSLVQQLPPDPMDLLGQRNLHWAGNINVFVGKRAVERHVAQALRIYPGRMNAAILIVGYGQTDSYSFELCGDGAEWRAQLDVFGVDLRTGKCCQAFEPGQWYENVQSLLVQLRLEPPASSEYGEVHVHVTRRSTQETAIVEFSLDASAQGPGCYTL